MKRYPRQRSEWKDFPITESASELLIGGWQVMQSWEQPLMRFLAEQVSWNGGDVLEIGYGMGISAREILKRKPRSYTVIEAHPLVAERARELKGPKGCSLNIIEGFWEDVIPNLTTKFDGILFDTFPLHNKERFTNHYPFISHSRQFLKTGGRFTFFSDETLPLRRSHMQLLFDFYQEVRLHYVGGLTPPHRLTGRGHRKRQSAWSTAKLND